MRAKFSAMTLLCLAVLALPGAVAGQAVSKKPASRANATRSNEAQRLRQFLAEDWKRWMSDYPEVATQVGYPGQNRRWTDFSLAATEQRNLHPRESLKTLLAIDRSKLPAAEQLNFDLYRKLLESVIEGERFHYDPLPFGLDTPRNLRMPLNQKEGVQLDVGYVINLMPAERASDYEDIVARLEGVPALVDQNIALLQQGLRSGLTPPKITLRDVPKQLENQIFSDALESPLLRAFRDFPASVTAAERERLTRAAVAAYAGKVVPAFRKLRDFLVETYIPGCRETIAATALPDGAAAYAYLVRWHTTTKLAPQQIHEIGLAEVKRIRAEMDKIIAQTGFRGSFAEFARFLRTDPRFFFDDAASLVTAYRDIAKRADPELARLFGKLPRLPYGVTPVPAYKAPTETTAYYEPGSPAAGRPGWYYVNTYNLKARPKWEMEALTLHEAVPGHHLQIALAQELEGVPEFRKHVGYTAFVEGWGLYAESLGEEMGFYTDPYSKFGELTYEIWRAVRLVIDTGMHAMGWSREQAIRFFLENTSKTEHDIVVEVDRYIVWPGQALAYKIGQLKIKELRAYATRELGDRFRIRAFHDQLHSQGALPLDVLEARMRAWVAPEKTR
jgi:uncharacterized protein (DUF885 family)